MRVARFMTAAGLAWLMAITMSVSPTAQTKTDEDFDKLMKSVGGTIGAIRKGAEGAMMVSSRNPWQMSQSGSPHVDGEEAAPPAASLRLLAPIACSIAWRSSSSSE